MDGTRWSQKNIKPQSIFWTEADFNNGLSISLEPINII